MIFSPFGLSWYLSSKESICQRRRCKFDQEDPLEKQMATHSSILTWEIHGQTSLVGYGPWGHKRVGHSLVTKQQQQYIPLRKYRKI